MKPVNLGLALCVATAISFSALTVRAQDAEKPVSDRAIAALTNFAIAYGGWVWEERCHKLDDTKREAYRKQTADNLLRLTSIFQPEMIGAASEAGRETASDPEYSSCSGENADFADFGYKISQEAADILKSIPSGYRLKVTP